MGRAKRSWVSQNSGSYHIISRIAGGEILLHDKEKEYFLKLLERLASGFFVQVHSFCVLGSHFHILATNVEKEAKLATREELIRRYRLIYGKDAEPPAGAYDCSGNLLPDEDGGTQRLRERLSSISRFVQELKQSFSRYYNKIHTRKGYLWSDRFKSVIAGIGDAQLLCSAYIDLNPIRANIVARPENYRWCSMGLQVRNPKRWKKLITPLSLSMILKPGPGPANANGKERNLSFSLIFPGQKEKLQAEWYREFVYIAGGIPRSDKACLSPGLVESVTRYHGQLGIGDFFRYRVKNISEGIAIGSREIIADIQVRYKRKFIRPRLLPVGGGGQLFVTRVLRG